MKSCQFLTLAILVFQAQSIVIVTSFAAGCFYSVGGAAAFATFMEGCKHLLRHQPQTRTFAPTFAANTVSIRHITDRTGIQTVALFARTLHDTPFVKLIDLEDFHYMVEHFFEAQQTVLDAAFARLSWREFLSGEIKFESARPVVESWLNCFSPSALELFGNGNWCEVATSFGSVSAVEDYLSHGGLIQNGGLMWNFAIAILQFWTFFLGFILLFRVRECEFKIEFLKNKLNSLQSYYNQELLRLDNKINLVALKVSDMDDKLKILWEAFEQRQQLDAIEIN